MSEHKQLSDTQIMVILGNTVAGASLVFGVLNVIYEIDMPRHQSIGMLFLLGVVIAGFGSIISKMQPRAENMIRVALWLAYGSLAVGIAWVAFAVK